MDFNGQSGGDSFFPFAQQGSAALSSPRQSHPFAASLSGWDPFPAPATAFGFSFFDTGGSVDAHQPQLLPLPPPHHHHHHPPFLRPSFSDVMQLRDPRFPNRPSRASSLAAGYALGIFRPPPALPPGPPQQIDLTLSSSSSASSESDDDNDGDTDPGSHRLASSAGEGSSRDNDDNDDDVEILQTVTPAQALGAAPSGPAASSARYLTYASVPPLRRKRRRVESASDDPADREMFNGKRAESTTVSMENNDVIERFKRSLKCSICLDVIQEMTSTSCGHVYCAKCIRLAIRATAKCPLCQRRLRPKDTHPLYF